MPTGRIPCPSCSGTGTVTENTHEYEFITRDPITGRCLVCNGRGYVNPRSKLPNGADVHTILPKKGLNVSNKKSRRGNSRIKPVINPGVNPTPKSPIIEDVPILNWLPGHDKTDHLLVNVNERYFLPVLRLIRESEMKRGRWTDQDESRYVDALERKLEYYTQKEANNG